MDWNPEEAISYYKTLGAPKDQTALIGLLKEILIPLLVISMVSTILAFLTTSWAVSLTLRLTGKGKAATTAETSTTDSTGASHE